MINFKLPILSLIIFLMSGVASCSSKDRITPEEPYTSDEFFVSPTGSDTNTGSREKPLQTIQAGIFKLSMGMGKTLTILEGSYEPGAMINIKLKGSETRQFLIRGDIGKHITVDGSKFNITPGTQYPYNNGLLNIDQSEWLTLQNITVKNSHRAAINIQQSSHINIINCKTENSLSPGISAWQGCSYIKVLGNTVINANNMGMSWDTYTGSEAPHEAISMAGPHHFEVAWNHVYNCKKEGIDVKETAAHGVVHHNYVHHLDRQGLYVDAWFGQLEDIEFRDNVVHNCEAGIAVSSEEGPDTKNIRIHHNLAYNNRATGLFFSRWGADNLREDLKIYNNTFYQNGWGIGMSGDPQYWLNGGCFIYSTNLKKIIITNNIFARNIPFEIGFSEKYGTVIPADKQIEISYNLIQDINVREWPFYLSTWIKESVWPTKGSNYKEGDPQFTNPASGDFTLKSNSPAINAGNPLFPNPGNSSSDIGAFPYGTTSDTFWWKNNFPPVIDLNSLN